MSNDAASKPGGLTWAIRILAIVVLVLGVAYAVRLMRSGPDREGTRVAAGPAFKNMDPDVAYVGTQACARCHEDRHASYLETTHSRSMSVVDPGKEPIPATFHHKPSDLHYRMYLDEKTGEMRIEESVEYGGSSPYVLADHVAKYLIGSGTHSRSYLVEIDGFMCEAPVTYFAKKGAWGISPGYDRTEHLGFARPTSPVCLNCHVGNVERIEGTVNKVKFHEQAIGCERCHGAGELHADLRSGEAEAPAADAHDLTIVDPKIMTRDQKMDLCAQCHMDHTLTVDNPGKQASDWRPGMPWTDVMVTYRPEQMWEGMTVVGHVDQLRQSACFQKSEMTCITCHDPHQAPPQDPVARAAHFQKACLQCHQHCGRQPDDGPGVVPPEGDRCIECHMPTSDTDILHIAFHHHRIGIHGVEFTPDQGIPAATPELVPMQDVSHMPGPLRERNLGIAYLKFASRQPWPSPVFFALRAKGQKLLESAHADGQRDGMVEALLARILFDDRQIKRAKLHAEAALARVEAGEFLSPDQHADALFILGVIHVRRGEVEEGRPYLEKVASMRREIHDIFELMAVAQRGKEHERHAHYARRALRILPNSPDAHFLAAEAFGAIGDDISRDLHNAVGRHLQLQQSRGVQHLKDGGDMAPK